MIENIESGSTFKEDPESTHECAKEILKTLGIKFDVFKMYEIVGVLCKYYHKL